MASSSLAVAMDSLIAETLRVATWSFGAVLVLGGVLAGISVLKFVFLGKT